MKVSVNKLGVAVIVMTALFVTACVFTAIVGVGDFTQPRALGILSMNEEESRAYVGLRTSGSNWDAIARVASIDVNTGAEMGTTPAWSGSWTTRAVATDPNNNHAWTLHENGSIVEWPLDLGSYTSYTNDFFEVPTGMDKEMFCDFEILSNGHYVATGIASVGAQFKGFFTYVQPHPAFPGDYYTSHTYWDIDEKSDIIRSCPRVSTDNSTGEVVFLAPDKSYYSGNDYVNRYEVYSWDGGGGNMYYGLSYVSGWALPNDIKFPADDISAEFGKTIVQGEYINLFGATSNGKLMLYDTSTAVLEDTNYMYETRAIDMVDFIVDDSYASGVLWWIGHDNSSNDEIGFMSFGN